MASLPLKANWTGWLYQPPWSGPRAGVASVTVGGVVSMWIRAVVATVIPELHVTSQVFGVPDAALSDDSVTTSQPEVLLTVVSAGDHCHPNLTLERYQAVQLSAGALPTEQAGVTGFRPCRRRCCGRQSKACRQASHHSDERPAADHGQVHPRGVSTRRTSPRNAALATPKSSSARAASSMSGLTACVGAPRETSSRTAEASNLAFAARA